MSTESDFAKLSDPTFQENAAKTIYETLLEVFQKYPTGR
jgi:N-acetylmuramoyl-L-alanine amidase